MEPPRSSSILRKSWYIRKPVRCVKFTKAVVRHANIRDQNPSIGMFCPGDPHQRNPSAPKFEDRSQQETEWQEQGAREAAWKLAKSILKQKEQERATFFTPSENRCLPASTLKPKEREFVVDSGASMHMISKKDLSKAEMDTLTKSCSPTIVITANGEVQTHEEAIVYVKELNIFLTMKVLENTPAVLSLAKRCERIFLRMDQRSKKHILLKTVFEYSATRTTSFRSWLQACQRVLPPVLPLQHQWHLQDRRLIIYIFLKLVSFTNHNCVKRQWDSSTGRSEWDRLPSSTCVKFTCWTNRTGWPRCCPSQPKIQNPIKTKTMI